MKILQYLIILTIVTGCSSANQSLTESKARERMNLLDQESQNNINSLIEMIEEQSLSKEKRFIPYEFNIPLDSIKKKEVQRIDPSIQFTNRSDTYQCIGENATKEKVYQIVALPYAYKIRFCPYE